MLEELNELLVESYCGERYERDRGYSRNGQRERTIVTLGEIPSISPGLGVSSHQSSMMWLISQES